ncbi:UNVERIFIED_CONTAM: hypothetical protein PYX00_005569 [Menopon gallinae]|uniref:Uncharacterized protein n=1 Tax=Menopon gallinae TaxID=328185 RepID=A0AAW2HS76_9NEOP
MFSKGEEIFPVQRHTKCRCLCRKQPEDCHPSQVYNESSCSCECTNQDAERKCKAQRQNNKIWNKDICSCQCREELECSTGLYFDTTTCRCEVRRGRRPAQPSWTTEIQR